MKKLLMLGLMLFFSLTVFAQMPTLLSVHGYLTKAGNPVASADIKIEISYWSDGHSPFYSEEFTGGAGITDGRFDLMLGATQELELNYNLDYYMNVHVNEGSGYTQIGSAYRFQGGQGQIKPNNLDQTAAYTFGSVIANSIIAYENLITTGNTTLGVNPDNNTTTINSSVDLKGPLTCSGTGSINAASCGISGGGGALQALLSVLSQGSDATGFTGRTNIGGTGIDSLGGYLVDGTQIIRGTFGSNGEDIMEGKFIDDDSIKSQEIQNETLKPEDVRHGSTVSSTESKIWTSENDGPDSGLDADRVDSRLLYWDSTNPEFLCYNDACSLQTNVACNPQYTMTLVLPKGASYGADFDQCTNFFCDYSAYPSLCDNWDPTPCNGDISPTCSGGTQVDPSTWVKSSGFGGINYSYDPSYYKCSCICYATSTYNLEDTSGVKKCAEFLVTP